MPYNVLSNIPKFLDIIEIDYYKHEKVNLYEYIQNDIKKWGFAHNSFKALDIINY
jgi:hypothetical protein